GWSSQLLFSDSCIVNALPVASSLPSSSPPRGSLSSTTLSGRNQVRLPISECYPSDALACRTLLLLLLLLLLQVQMFPDLRLTEEEQKLLTEEGVSLPRNLPLTKVKPKRV
ncbi:hypothetical protein XENOCAPTIV_018708, partial [Xenoophorus captivus]